MRQIILISLLTAFVLSGCATNKQDTPDRPESDDRAVGHIHGLGVDPADGTLYAATHFGLFRVTERDEPLRVADRWQDTMAFTVVGPGHFLASGHPDLREDLPPHLGLIESTDAGETWQPLALQGEADFHILEQAGTILYAYDATSGRLLATQDKQSFDEVAQLPLLSLTTDPQDPDRLLGTTTKGQLVSIGVGTGTVSDLPGPKLVLLDTTADGDVVGIAPAGVIQLSGDGGKSWKPRGGIGGQPAAFTVTVDGWYAATTDHVFHSADEGVKWTKVL